MDASRRGLIKGLCTLPALSLPLSNLPIAGSSIALPHEHATSAPTLPDKTNFTVQGVYMDAAYTHPLGMMARAAYNEYMDRRSGNDRRIGPGNNPRNTAVE